MTAEREGAKQHGDRLYEQFGKPLETQYAGQYVAIAADGQVLLGDTMLDVAQKARDAFGPGSFLFKLGPRAVYTLR